MDKPFILQFLEVMDARYQLDYKSKGRLKSEKIGYSRHMQFDEMIKPLVPDNWELLHDISFELNYGRTQIDTLLIAPHGFYHFEVKNLLSEYEYSEGEWRSSSGVMVRNYFTQLNRQSEIISGLMLDFGIKAPLESKLVLINEDDTVKFFENKSSEYLKRGQIRSYMKEIKLTNQVLISPKEVAKRLKQQSVPSYKDIKIEEKNLVKDVMTGILCAQCASNMIDKSRRFHLQCIKCGASEPKE